jgi:hypothetical protein
MSRVYERATWDVGGEQLTAFEVAERLGIKLTAARRRLEIDPKSALLKPVCHRRDLTGETSNELTARQLVAYQFIKGPTKYHRIPVWECECSCGQIVLVPYDKFVTRRKKSCGCMNKPWKGDLVGQTKGFLKVLRCFDEKPTRKALYECECVCGNLCQRRGTTLMMEERSSCGCKRWEAHGAAMVNRRRRVDVFGEQVTLGELSKVAGVHETTLRKRIDGRGMTPTEAAFGREVSL